MARSSSLACDSSAPRPHHLLGNDRGLRLPSYREALAWAVTLSSSVRVLSYLPTLWAVHSSGNSSQHSLLTWGAWVTANLTMAAWLYESNERRLDRVVAVNCGNAAMCLMTFCIIAAYRF